MYCSFLQIYIIYKCTFLSCDFLSLTGHELLLLQTIFSQAFIKINSSGVMTLVIYCDRLMNKFIYPY
jgi:hypothetical protein